MAKMKQAKEADPIVEPENGQKAGAQKVNAEVAETAAEPETTVEEDPAKGKGHETKGGDNPEKAAVPQDEIPAFALNYLKRHAEIKEVYIDKLGGVFSANTPKVFLKDATLYQNPFYK